MKSNIIFIIDDDPDIQQLMTAFLSYEGFIIRNALSASQALKMLEIEEPDLIIMDIQMPDMDGITLCDQIRKQYPRPILFVSGARNQELKARSLQSGGDDYISKPFDPEELVLRVKSNLRWSNLLNPTPLNHTKLEFPGLSIDLERMTVMVEHQPVSLLAKEFQLLIMLARKPNQVFHPEQIYRQVWDDDSYYSKNTVKTHIFNLRKKIEPTPALPRYIVTSGRLGYKFNPYGIISPTAISE
ncbi:response regulator transcription factor [Paenibacillus paeoniae]|uniref:DNA-binding response regulator n=1 Tax=Paenibacillus paeoniae TaxID=2292705 RepID=A0A371PHA7_9BACL|nr:response regulator transcription factor [Paenibacillus paeoniae]REK75588.1 DNA-binding response regulator [Paenibacillus paeoniae]